MNETKELVARLKNGERGAFDDLYEQYHLSLYRSACLMLGNVYDAEDVLQETFITAWTQIGTLRHAERLKPWLYRIMTHLVYKVGKKNRREQADADIVDKKDRLSVSQNNLDETIERDTEQDAVRQALQQLKIKQREVIVLYYYNDLSIRDIALTCGCFEGTVKSRLYAARKELQRLLAENSSFSKETGGKTG